MDEKVKQSLELILKWLEQSGNFIKKQTPIIVFVLLTMVLFFLIFYNDF